MSSFTISKIVLATWFLGVVSLTRTFRLNLDPQPPTWPSAFSIAFYEEIFVFIAPISGNEGAWHYDYANGRARYDHLEGQSDEFCLDSGLKLSDNHSDCHLIFATDMYVHYPREKQCCRACGPAEGCTVLKPAWLTGAKYIGKENISGMVCHGWEKQGAVASDRWFQTEEGMPCQYSESFKLRPELHTVTFSNVTYKVGPIKDSIFHVPKYCNRTCPSPYKPPPRIGL
ncbi:uncharacterized protein [Branchiostoma lanceolatum]|uniref:uncharacterized protein n=1 Tax=Branchiostoma lanceolatum TaxID=7740 RepID=UPI0034563492